MNDYFKLYDIFCTMLDQLGAVHEPVDSGKDIICQFDGEIYPCFHAGALLHYLMMMDANHEPA